jgi:hypothetical protein
LGLRGGGEEITGGWTKLCSGGFHDLYHLPYLFKGDVIKKDISGTCSTHGKFEKWPQN